MDVPFPRELGIDRLGDVRSKKLSELRYEARKELRPVESLVDVFDGIAGYCEWTDDSDMAEVYDRAAGLAAVATMNGELLDADNRDWRVLVEIGKRVCKPLISMTLCANGVGTIGEHGDQPIRLVRPTSEELAAYPLPERIVPHA